MSKRVRILLVEDVAADAELMERELKRGGINFTCQRVETREEFLKALKESPPDVVLADYSLPQFHGMEALMLSRQHLPEVSFVCVSGAIGEETAVELMKQGAADFVPKQTLEKLVPAVQRALREGEKKNEKKRAESTLRDSEARFRAVFEGAGTGIALEDLSGRILETNRALQQMLGYSAEELQDITRRDFTHTRDHKEEAAQYERLLSGKADHYQAEKRFVRKDGRIFWGQLTVSMVRDANGKPTFPLAMIEDITERQRAEEAFLQYAAIVESSHDAIVSETFDGVIIGWNPAAERVYGFTSREANGRSASIIVPSDREEEFSAILERTKRGESIGNFETTRLRKDGSVIHVSVTASPIKDASGRIVGVSSISRDITERKRAEEALRKSEAENQKLAAFAQFNPNAVMELAADGTINYSNEAAQQMARSLDKPSPAQILPSETPSIVKQCLSSGKSRLRFETTIQNRMLSWSFFPIPAVGVVHCYASDITERQNLEAQLRQSQKMESIGQLAGGVAHDFNNILTVIQGHTSLLTMSKLQDDAMDSAQQIGVAAERAANLTRQLLTFSRRQILQPKNLDLNEVVSNMTKMLRRLLGEDITLQVNYARALPMVQADPGMMEQVLMNLSVNARDAMPKGGRLYINTCVNDLDEALAAQTPGATAGKYVCLCVKDTGKGIPAEILPHIFEPFFTTKDVGKGTGLGLATVYGIVQQHRGFIKVSSKPDKETTFSVCFPALATKSGAADAGDQQPAVRGGTETILVVEDETPLRVLVRSVLKRYGYEVLEASSGVDALPIWLEHKDRIKLLLTDMVMPHGVSGRELAERLRGDKPGLKVIYSSGYSLAMGEAGMVLREGLNFLQKPYNPIKLARAVRDCLDA